MNMALVYRVEPGYLAAMGIPLKQGRFFTEQDNERSPNVVVIDEALARKYFPNSDPIGKRLNLEGAQWQIIGMVGHVNQWSLGWDDRETLQAQLYLPFRQLSGRPRAVNVVMRVEGGSGKAGIVLPVTFDSIRGVIQSQNTQNIIFRPQTMNEVIAGTLATQRFSMTLLGAFAAVALLLASVGLYGVISYLVGQRTQELGVRIALGARRKDILRLVVNHGMKMALGGVAVGLLAALGLTRLLAQMLYGVSATDPATFTVIALLLAAVALAACFIPAWRATRVDPLVALRHD
jgi:predicted permease